MAKTVSIVSGIATEFERSDTAIINSVASAGSNRATAFQLPDIVSIETIFLVSGSGGVLMPTDTQIGDRVVFIADSALAGTLITIYLQTGETIIQTSGADHVQLAYNGLRKVSSLEWAIF